ncbi:uncharacterized protein K02A2.6-like [Schistocerca gregaria]|uniref:uncharacterized protein K02A2.6-like n=1 Tax=Schistocerca gregaria TaxID=7010 RepID=UPI00211F26D9|nr:uncharacterized protein K02A2.6-like [Schistocerca gregaria]
MGHWGVILTKQLAHQHIYWWEMDAEIAGMVASCPSCQQQQAVKLRRLVAWPDALSPRSWLHLDFVGPFLGFSWLILVVAGSRFPYVMTSTTSAQTIQALSCIFAIEGLPETLVTDNGPQFTSAKFKAFCTTLGIRLINTAPFHAAFNRLAEWFVRTFCFG